MNVYPWKQFHHKVSRFFSYLSVPLEQRVDCSSLVRSISKDINRMPLVDNPCFISMKVDLVLFHFQCDLHTAAGNVQINWNEFDSDFSPTFSSSRRAHSTFTSTTQTGRCCWHPSRLNSFHFRLLQFHACFATMFI